MALRSYGRIGQTNGIGGTWVEVTTDSNGYNDAVWLTTLIQTLKLNLGESPFYGNFGIPAQQSVVTNVFPDFYAAQTQTQFAPYFASLSITRIQGSFPPAYNVQAVCHNGAIVGVEVPSTYILGTQGGFAIATESGLPIGPDPLVPFQTGQQQAPS